MPNTKRFSYDTVSFDRHELINELENSGFTRQQSEAVISVLKKSQNDLATEADSVIATTLKKIRLVSAIFQIVQWVKVC
jgi:hypothetical protein